MTDKERVLTVLDENKPRWCKDGVSQARRLVKSMPDDATLAQMIDAVPVELRSEWCYWWARDIGDREVMRDRVTGK